jgi:hypothetical protein
MVSRVYQKCGPESCLRRVFQEALKTVGTERLLREWEEWSQVAKEGGVLGIDLLRAVAERRNGQSPNPHWRAQPIRIGEPCRFHNHGRQNLPAEMGKGTGLFGNQECPFRGVECFPVGPTEEGSPGGGIAKEWKFKRGPRIQSLVGELGMDEAPREETPQVIDNEPPLAENPELEPELEPEPTCDEPVAKGAEPELEQEAIYDEPATNKPEPKPELEPTNDEPAANLEDGWGIGLGNRRDKKKKKKTLSWNMVDRPADLADPEENSGE